MNSRLWESPWTQLLLLFIVPLMSNASSDPCSGSYCICLRKTVTCAGEPPLSSIPPNFSPGSQVVLLRNQMFADKTLRRQNISYLVSVTSLSIINSGLTAIEVGAFSDLKYLSTLDLARNNIRIIYDNTFRGVDLQYLFLNGNRGLKLQPRSFVDAKIQRLSMKECGLKQLHFQTFLALNRSLNSLFLQSNDIQDFDPSFEQLFGHLNDFQVGQNPLRCKCRLRWLVAYLKRTSHNSPTSIFQDKKQDDPVCAFPQSLTGTELKRLSPDQLTCDPPRLGDVEVAMLSADSGRLRCSASGYPLPVIRWTRKGSRKPLRIAEPRSQRRFFPSPYPVTNALVGVDRLASEETYECTATNAGGNVTLKVLLKWPSKPVIPPRENALQPTDRRIDRRTDPSSSGQGRKTSWGTRSEVGPDLETEDSNPFFQKKFTLLELIGAVVGTFTATLALFLLICRCITYAKKKQKKQQWSTYESAYSGSHVYDVPRHDQTSYMVAKPTMGTIDRHEFLDYKTGRKVYDHV